MRGSDRPGARRRRDRAGRPARAARRARSRRHAAAAGQRSSRRTAAMSSPPAGSPFGECISAASAAGVALVPARPRHLARSAWSQSSRASCSLRSRCSATNIISAFSRSPSTATSASRSAAPRSVRPGTPPTSAPARPVPEERPGHRDRPRALAAQPLADVALARVFELDHLGEAALEDPERPGPCRVEDRRPFLLAVHEPHHPPPRPDAQRFGCAMRSPGQKLWVLTTHGCHSPIMSLKRSDLMRPANMIGRYPPGGWTPSTPTKRPPKGSREEHRHAFGVTLFVGLAPAPA